MTNVFTFSQFIADKDTLGLPEGEWLHEPDFCRWRCPISGMECVIVRNGDFFTLNGYVGIPDSHPLHGSDQSTGLFSEYLPHGGLSAYHGVTYSGNSVPLTEPYHFEPESSWFFGFDTLHYRDMIPKLETSNFPPAFRELSAKLNQGKTYKNLDFVRGYTTRLAIQLQQANVKIEDFKDLINSLNFQKEES